MISITSLGMLCGGYFNRKERGGSYEEEKVRQESMEQFSMSPTSEQGSR